MKKMNVCGKKFKIKFVKKVSEKDYYGQIFFKKEKIFLKKGLNDFDTFETLVHETNHAIVERTGIIKKFNKGDVELIVSALTHGFLDTIKRNKLLKKEMIKFLED